MNSEALILEENAYYLYCVANNFGRQELLAPIAGIEGKRVYPIEFRNIVIVVHDTPAQLYAPEDEQLVLQAVIVHDKVIETVGDYYESTLPFTFNTIIKGVDGKTSKDSLAQWAAENYDLLLTKLDKVCGKKEYVVTVVMDCRAAGAAIMATDIELKEMQERIIASSRGKAFFIKEKMQAIVKEKIAQHADKLFQEIYPQIIGAVTEYRVEKAESETKDLLTLMKISCLANKSQCTDLSSAIDTILQNSTISVTFSGPWPPYSFT
ncbi:MAG: GvpL/GvpF family gas vesicle protein [Negativicutes bacterium]